MFWEIWEDAISKKDKKAISNFFNSLKERSNAETNVKSKPYIMLLDPVGYCNLKCPFCSTGKGSLSRDRKKLSLDVFKDIIDHLGPYLFKLQLYNWGEPLLNKDLPQMVSYAKKHHVVTEISTNLSFPMSKEYAEEIVNSGLDFVLCSIDGASQETYQKYRVGGDFNLTMKNMKMLNDIRKEKKLKTPFLIWRFLVFRHNQHEIEKAKKMAKKLEVEITFLRAFVDKDKPEWASTLTEFMPLNYSAQEIENVNSSDSNKLITIASTNDKKEVFYSSGNTETNLSTNKKEKSFYSSGGDSSKTSDDSMQPCTWLWSSMTINANGSVSPCCAIENQNNDFGFVEDSVEKI